MSSPRNIVVLGAGGHAKVVLSTLRAEGWTVVALFDDREALHGERILDVVVCGLLRDATRSGCPGVIGIGSNDIRRRVADEVVLDWATAVHPAATVDPSARLGAGTVAFAGSVIQAETHVGCHVVINTSASIDHDCVVGDFVHVAPGAHVAGGVTIGAGALLGTGCTVVEGVHVGEGSTVGAGAVVLHDVQPNAVVVGVPARPIH